MLNKIRTALSLSRNDWLILLEAWWTLFWVRLVLTVLPFARWRRHFLSATCRITETPDDEQWRLCRRCSQMLSLASRYHVFPLRCLHKSVALQRLLERRAIRTCLHIGIRKNNKELDGHAWLEIGARVINDRADVGERYRSLTGLSQRFSNPP